MNEITDREDKKRLTNNEPVPMGDPGDVKIGGIKDFWNKYKKRQVILKKKEYNADDVKYR